MTSSMKQFKYIFATLLLAATVPALADTVENPAVYSNYKIENGVATAKSVSAPDANNIYSLTLETFATGLTTVVHTSTPVDVILILDTSSSMTQYTYTYTDDNGNQVTGTRLAALKYAVKKFVNEIARNDAYDDDNNPRAEVLGNRIQIITFNADTSALFTAFQPAANASTINTSVDAISASTGTRTDLGMEAGITWVQNSISSKPNSNRVVVMFTDGCPSTRGATNFDANYASDAVNYAYTIKTTTTYNGVRSNTGVATVYSIGLIDWPVLSQNNRTYVRNMMDYISSNFPDGRCTSTSPFTCTGNRVDTSFNFYVDANETDLGVIFEDIAVASGGSESTIPGETQLVDGVSSSFVVPSTFTASDVVVYTRKALSDGSGWDENSRQDLTTVVLPTTGENAYDLNSLPPADADYMTDENKVGVYLKDGQLVIVGFNYSKPDSDDADGSTANPYDGNWVGWRYDDNGSSRQCAGKELVVHFNIEAIDGVTGGDHTNTNTSSSGVYVPTYDADGNFTGYSPATTYPYPDTDLPINLVIVKDGMRSGESATIQIYMAPQKAGVYDTVTGKPAPDLTSGWQNFTKVILTNKGEDGARVTKKLLCLDPKYVYRLVEDNWGWSYILDTNDITTSQQVSNPFVFTNTLKAAAVKHAEAVSINHFGENAQAETYKSSKVESF